MRDDFANLLLADVDVSALPVQPFDDPQRNWFLRATLLDQSGAAVVAADSQPFCRLAHDPPQPAIGTVKIDADNLLYVNDKPWMPWGVTYGHTPVYAGPADPARGSTATSRTSSRGSSTTGMAATSCRGRSGTATQCGSWPA